MRTDLYLLMLTDGRPVMRLRELAKLMDKEERTIQKRIYSGTFPIKTFKLDTDTVAHVSDVAAYIDAQRDGATHLLQTGS